MGVRLTLKYTGGVSETASGDLCIECGLCCSDAMFSNVRLEEADRERLKAIGYPVAELSDGFMPLTCAMLAGTRCTIYHDRPEACRSYRCEILKAAEAGSMPMAEAQLHVREALGLLGQLREAMPEGITMEMARARWNPREVGSEPVEPDEARAQLAFFAYYRYMDRHFRPPHRALVAPAAETRPDR
jgi:uncharacterized protein